MLPLDQICVMHPKEGFRSERLTSRLSLLAWRSKGGGEVELERIGWRG
jgi:hypothetical protein